MAHHGHAHEHGHDHAPAKGTPLRALLTALGITAVVLVAEIVGGLLSRSLALIADAMHMLSDATGLIVAVIAVVVGRRGSSTSATYGYRSVEALAAAVNATAVVAVSVWIVVAAISRAGGHAHIDTGVMGGVAVVGLVANAASAWVLSRQRAGSLNVEGAFLHVLSDMLGSVAVIVAALVIRLTGFTAADVIASLVIAALVLPRAVALLGRALGALLGRVPRGYDMADITQRLESLPDVVAIHDLHVWSRDGVEALATCHLVVEHSECTGPVLDAAQAAFREVGIHHATIQIEHPEHRGHEHIC